MRFLKNNVISEKLYIRVITLVIIFLMLFYGVVIISYYLLPEGILLDKNSVLDWETSNNLFISAIQIFAFNLISAVVVAFANFIPFPSRTRAFMPLGYWCLIVLYILNGITLGTWSFTAVQMEAPGLSERLLRMFDIFNRSGLWEMIGQLLIASASARIAIVKKDGIDIYGRSIKEAHLTRQEIAVIIFGICLMLIGSFIESNAIIQSL